MILHAIPNPSSWPKNALFDEFILTKPYLGEEWKSVTCDYVGAMKSGVQKRIDNP